MTVYYFVKLKYVLLSYCANQ